MYFYLFSSINVLLCLFTYLFYFLFLLSIFRFIWFTLGHILGVGHMTGVYVTYAYIVLSGSKLNTLSYWNT